jgi:hypothetical protein
MGCGATGGSTFIPSYLELDADGESWSVGPAVTAAYGSLDGPACSPGNWFEQVGNEDVVIPTAVHLGWVESGVSFADEFASVEWDLDPTSGASTQQLGGVLSVVAVDETTLDLVIAGGTICETTSSDDDSPRCRDQVTETHLLITADFGFSGAQAEGFAGYGVALDSGEPLCGLWTP